MLKWVLKISFCCSVLLSGAQTISFKLLDSIHGSIDEFSVDNIGNLYLTNQDVIVKLNAEHDTMFSASLKSITPQYIQASKSFRILTFDKDRSTIQFLDNTLSDLSGELDLFDLDVVRPILVCESFNGNSFWVLDAGSLRLLKVNEKMEVISQVDNLSFLNNSEKLPTKMLEYNDRLYILIPNERIMVFDVFGSYIRDFEFKSNDFSIQKNTILNYVSGQFNFFSLSDWRYKLSHPFNLSQVDSFQFSNNMLYINTPTALLIYQISVKNPPNNK